MRLIHEARFSGIIWTFVSANRVLCGVIRQMMWLDYPTFAEV
jgi:hypothetical protein